MTTVPDKAAEALRNAKVMALLSAATAAESSFIIERINKALALIDAEQFRVPEDWNRTQRRDGTWASDDAHLPAPETGLGLETTAEERKIWYDYAHTPPAGRAIAQALIRDIDRLLAALSASREQEREACELLTLRARDADENSFCRKVLDKLAIIRARGQT